MRKVNKKTPKYKFGALSIIFLLILASYGNFIFNFSNVTVNYRTDDHSKGSDDFITNSPLANPDSENYLNLSKIFPLVLKEMFRADFYTEINFTIQNTLDLPLHNFSLKYIHIKNSIEEYPISINTYPDSEDFERLS